MVRQTRMQRMAGGGTQASCMQHPQPTCPPPDVPPLVPSGPRQAASTECFSGCRPPPLPPWEDADSCLSCCLSHPIPCPQAITISGHKVSVHVPPWNAPDPSLSCCLSHPVPYPQAITISGHEALFEVPQRPRHMLILLHKCGRSAGDHWPRSQACPDCAGAAAAAAAAAAARRRVVHGLACPLEQPSMVPCAPVSSRHECKGAC